jgi:hypothetical protein
LGSSGQNAKKNFSCLSLIQEDAILRKIEVELELASEPGSSEVYHSAVNVLQEPLFVPRHLDSPLWLAVYAFSEWVWTLISDKLSTAMVAECGCHGPLSFTASKRGKRVLLRPVRLKLCCIWWSVERTGQLTNACRQLRDEP